MSTPKLPPDPAAKRPRRVSGTPRAAGSILLLLLIALSWASSGAWFPTAPLNEPRSHFPTATRLADGRVLVTGGAGGADSGVPLRSAEIYDPAENTWSLAAPMDSARHFHSATLLANGRVLVAGGNNGIAFLSSAAIYDPALNTWSSTGDMITPRDSHTATALADGRVLVAGGSGATGLLSSAEIYDPVQGKWLDAGSMSLPRVAHSASLLSNGRVLAAGGQGGRPS